MFKLLKKIISVGDTTTKYPFAPYEVAEDFRGKPEYDPTQCIACAACTTACPANALTMTTNLDTNERKWSIFYGRCIFCGRCEEVCPTKAITLSQEFELAVFSKDDLFQEAVFNVVNCRVCGEPFAAKKSIDYAISLLVQTGLPKESVEQQRPHFETCPACKRRQNLISAPNIAVSEHLHQEAGK